MSCQARGGGNKGGYGAGERGGNKCLPHGGTFIGFRLFPPSVEVTDDDRRLFQMYKERRSSNVESREGCQDSDTLLL
ncbi:MAG: hypothetical protein IIY87_05110 [Bacteroidales bacterium]|nr:hypothetical protein [Bacteroidales bacterium]